MNTRKITVDGLTIRTIEEGSGPAVLLVHGGTLGFSGDMWLRTIGPLARRGYRVIAYDQPGFGESDPPADFGLRYRQDFIARFLAALGIGRAALVGHSQAGGLVVGAALDTPALFSGIVVLGTGSLLPPLAKGSHDVDPPMKEPSLADTRALLESTLVDHSAITPEVLAAYHAMSIGRNFTHAVRRAEAASAQGRGTGQPLWQRLGDVTIPSLYIYGANDRGNAAERVDLARQRFPALTFHLLDRCHHIVQWDRAADVDRLVAEFLARLPAQAAGDKSAVYH